MLRANGYDELLGNFELDIAAVLLDEEERALFYSSQYGEKSYFSREVKHFLIRVNEMNVEVTTKTAFEKVLSTEIKQSNENKDSTSYVHRDFCIYVNYSEQELNPPLYLIDLYSSSNEEIQSLVREEGIYHWRRGVFWSINRNKQIYIEALNKMLIIPIIHDLLQGIKLGEKVR